jgi:hypothetical protein
MTDSWIATQRILKTVEKRVCFVLAIRAHPEMKSPSRCKNVKQIQNDGVSRVRWSFPRWRRQARWRRSLTKHFPASFPRR